MTNRKVGVRKLREELPSLLQQVAATGERIEVTKRGDVVATLMPGSAAAPAPAPAPEPEPTLHGPRVVTLASLKGGVGKTTLAMHLAAAAAETGESVIVLDADEECSALRWQQQAHAADIRLPMRVVAAERNRIARQVRELSPGHLIVIDTPPNDREIMKTACMISDVVLVPVMPTGLDIDRLATTLELLADMEAGLPNFNYAVILNRFDARKVIAHAANQALESQPRLETVIRALAAYEKVFAAVPTELEQFHDIWKELRSVLGGSA